MSKVEGDAIHILHLEDNAHDGELVREFLASEGVEAEIRRVWTREDFVDALSESPDIILADHQLPSFDGEAALELARCHAPRVPFVFVSGTLGEDVAVEALKRGATDYVVKQRLDRLPMVVRRAMDEERERRARREVERALRLSEDSFVAFADAAPLLCWMAEPDGALNWYNRRWYEYTGTTPDAMKGWGWRSVHDPDVLPDVVASWQEALRTGEPWEMIFPLRSADGSFRDFLSRANPVRDADGRVLRWIGVNVDISAQRAAEQARREAEERLRLATQGSRVGIWDYDPRNDVLRWDPLCKAMFGLPADASVRWDVFVAGLHPDDRERVLAATDAAMDPAGDGEYETQYRTIGLSDGIERWISARGRATFDAGRVVRFVGTVFDITDRKAAVDALSASEAALRAESRALEILNRVSAEIAAEFDIDRVVQAVVDAGVELSDAQFGAFFYTVREGNDRSYMLYALSGADKSDFERFPMVRETELFGPTLRGEGVIRSDDITADPRYGRNAPHYGMPKGHLPVRSYLAAPVCLRSGEPVGGLFFGHRERAVFTDRTERLVEGLASQAATGIENARLFESAQRLNETLESQVAERTAERDRIWQVSDDLLGVADLRGTWRSINPAWRRMLGWEPDEIIGRTSEWIKHPDDRDAARRQLARLAQGEQTIEYRSRLRTRDGDYRSISWRVAVADGALYYVGRDITSSVQQAAALAEAEEGLRQAQKMETLGQLTGGVAHDFNNLLQIVIGNLDMMKRQLPDDTSRLRRAADNAYAGAERAATLTQRLLAFARRQPLAPRPCSANELLAGMSELVHRTIGEAIEVETRLSDEDWLVEVDANQLESALLNLAVNARDAMPDGGRLDISIENSRLAEPLDGQNPIPAGEYVVITVADTGEGMAPDVLKRVFEPFFTTKEVGRGTGLGLSMVYGFVKQSGGHVYIDSVPGEGTSVRVFLPRLVVEGAEHARPSSAASAEIAGGHETILVCEDDDGVRANSVESLRELGYDVLVAANAREALDLLVTRKAPVDLLFTDVVLPGGMTGSDLAQRARGIQPDLRVLFTTGYARDAIVHHGRLDEGVELIAKPFAFHLLAQRVRAMLDG